MPISEHDRTAMQNLVAKYLEEDGEEGGQLLVETLANVGLGYLEVSLGTLPAISPETERKQMANHLVRTYLQGTRPSPTNIYMAQLRQVALAYLRDVRPQPEVSDAVLKILVTLAMGHTRETDPRATRMVATTRFVDLYLAGR